MAITHPEAVRNDFAALINTRANAGAGPAQIIVRDGATVLLTAPLGDPAFGAPAAGVLPLSPVAAATVAESGTPDNFSVTDSDGGEVFSGSVGDTGSGEDLEVEIPTGGWLAGATVDITGGTYTAPA